MANLQYTGARYVPILYTNPDDNSNNWKSGESYKPLTIVTYLNDSYTSKIPVPASIGNPADNSDYWVKTGNFNAAMTALQEEVQELQQKVTSEGFIETFNEVSNDLSVNKWHPDNNKINQSSSLLSNLVFKEISRNYLNFKTELLIDEWKPFNSYEKEIAIHPLLNLQGNTDGLTFLKNGYKVTPTANERTSIDFQYVLFAKQNSCAKFRVYGNPSAAGAQWARTGLSFNGRTIVYFDNGTKQVRYEIAPSYTPTALNEKLYENVEWLDFMCFIGTNNISVYVSADDSGYEYLGTTPTVTGTHIGQILTNVHVYHSSLTGIIKDVKLVYTACSFADCKYIHYDDTTPYIQDGKAYLTATLQSYGSNFTGILRHTLGLNDLELVGIIQNSNDYSAIGADICFDRKNKRFICLFRADIFEDSEVVANKIQYCINHNNNFNGVINFTSEDLPTVTNHDEFGNYSSDEDPCIAFFNNHWYIGINRIETASYYYDIFESDDEEFNINNFHHIQTISSNSLTGGCFQILNNNLYLICGNGTAITVFNTINGGAEGNLNVSIANRVWGNITAINRGKNTKFYLTTFDRNLLTSSNWSYGGVHMYESTSDIDELVVNNTYTL